jgi:ATP-binding cassette subfamily B protein
MMIALAGVMFWCNWKISLVVFTVVPPLILVSMKFQKRILHSSRQVRKTNSQITAAYNEGIAAVRTTKTLLREDSNLMEFQQLTSTMYDQSVRNAIQSAMYLPFVQTLGAIGAGLALWYGGLIAMSGAITLGTLILFITCANRFFDPVNEMARVLTDLLAAQASAERVMGLITTVPEIQDSPAVREAIAQRAGSVSDGANRPPQATAINERQSAIGNRQSPLTTSSRASATSSSAMFPSPTSKANRSWSIST